jgi:hypothetical protein
MSRRLYAGSRPKADRLPGLRALCSDEEKISVEEERVQAIKAGYEVRKN